MKILGISASYGLHVALLDDKKVLFSYSNAEELRSDNLLQIIDDGLKKCKLDFEEIDALAVCVGPGSFTGSRVAISLAKGLLVGRQKKIITFESFDAFGSGNVMLSGFGNFVYVKDETSKACVDMNTISKFSGVTDSKILADKFGLSLAKFDMANAIAEKLSCGEIVDESSLTPVYLRASQAEIERDKKNDRR